MKVLDKDSAVFLDFDGTLVDIAGTPQAVVLPQGLLHTLTALHELLGGAIACISGRSYQDLTGWLGNTPLALVGSHGAELLGAAPPNSQLQDLATWCSRELQAWPSTLVETKSCGLALHWRQAPQAESKVRQLADQLLQALPEHRLCEGKKVLELVPRQSNKGIALQQLMQRPEFRGKRPIFVGDDYTDIPAMQAAQNLGGVALAVGDRVQDYAQGGFNGPAQVIDWLRRSAHALREEAEARSLP